MVCGRRKGGRSTKVGVSLAQPEQVTVQPAFPSFPKFSSFCLGMFFIAVFVVQLGKCEDSCGTTNFMSDGTATISVHMAEPHSEAWPVWVSTLKSAFIHRVDLVHIDSHSDMMRAYVPKDFDKKSRLDKWLFQSRAEIGDFITRGLFTGLVGHVSWLRSNFSGVYNAPAPGHWVNHVCYDEDRQELNFKKYLRSENTSSSELKVLQGYEPQVNSNWDQTGGKVFPQHFKIPIEVSASLLNTLNDVPSFTSTSGRPWILDIDLDFFASDDPIFAYFGQHGFNADWVKKHYQNAFTCRASSWRVVANTMKKVVKKFKPPRLTSTALVAKYLERVSRGKCKLLSLQKFRSLMFELHGSTIKMGYFNRLFQDAERREVVLDDFINTMFDGEDLDSDELEIQEHEHQPWGHPSVAEIRATASRVGDYLKTLVRKNGPPALITIARSEVEDMYLPPALAHHVQNATMEMLIGVFPHQLHLQYHDSVRVADRIKYENILHH